MKTVPLFNPPIYFLRREALIFWRYIKKYMQTGDGPLICIVPFFTAWLYNRKGWDHFFPSFFLALAISFLFTLTFAISNQLNSKEEDIHNNKASRPMPSGLVNRQTAIYRLIFYSMLYLFVALLVDQLIFWITAGWIAFIICYDNLRWDKHWYIKNPVENSLGPITIFVSTWYAAAPLSQNIWTYMILTGCWIGITNNVQDFKDVAGDKKAGRKTIPILLGDQRARLYMSLYLFAISPILYSCIILSQGSLQQGLTNTFVIGVLVFQTLWQWFVAYRLLRYRTAKQDEVTYICEVLLWIFTIIIIYFLHLPGVGPY